MKDDDRKGETVETINGYKATDKNLQCLGYQYVVGETYTHDGEISLCNSGFHFCENPLDVLDYYNLCESEFLTVEADGKCKRDDKKTVTNKLKVSASIGLPGFIKASVEWIFKNNKDKSTDCCKIAASGDFSQLAASGYSSKLAASGYSSKLAASGDFSKLAASGDYSIAAGIGINCTAKGSLGSWIVLAEWSFENDKNRWVPVCVLSSQVDGKNLKADTFYKVKGGEFVEVMP